MSESRHRTAWLVITGVLLGIGLAGCGGDDERAESTAGAEPASGAESAARPAPSWHEPASATPLLSLSLNDSAELELHRGWPLIVRASVLHPAAFEAGAPAEPLAITGPAAELHVRVSNAAGEAQSWPLHAAAPPPDELRLERDGSADVLFWLDGAETAALADGRYALVAELGSSTSPPAWLTLSAEPVPLPPARAREKRLRSLALLLLRGDHAAARAEVDALLREQADDVAALEVSGDLFAAEGRSAEARDAYTRALRVIFARDPKPPEPPVALLRKQQAVMQDVLVPE